jgi:thiamine biosynthesis lipoprotein
MKKLWLHDLFIKKQASTASGDLTATKAERTFYAMGTLMSFTVYGVSAPEMLDTAAALIVNLDALLSRLKTDSEITRLNLSAGGSWIKVREETDAALREAMFYAAKTGGIYDPAVGTLVDLWAIKNRREQNLPDADEIGRALVSCDYKNIETDNAGRYRIHKGASIDLGGIGKGYAADRVYTWCQKQGVRSALFSLGTSSVAALGTKPDGSAWKIGLKTIDAETIACYGMVHLKNQFLSTSADYEQGFVKEGRRYHHILDKNTGYPADNGLRSVTVIADNGARSEAYSTALFIMGLEKALDFHKREGGFEAILVSADKRVVCTPGIQARFEFRGKAWGYHYAPGFN